MLPLYLLSDGIFYMHRPKKENSRMYGSYAVFLGSPDEGLLLKHVLKAGPLGMAMMRAGVTNAEFSALYLGLRWLAFQGLLRKRELCVCSDNSYVVSYVSRVAHGIPHVDCSQALLPIQRLLREAGKVDVCHYPGKWMKRSIIHH